MFAKRVTVNGVTFDRRAVDRLLQKGIPDGGFGWARNLYVVGPSGAKVGAKKILYELGVGDHHGYDAASALLQLGLVVRAKRAYDSHWTNPALAPYLKTGRFMHDQSEKHGAKGQLRSGRDQMTMDQRQAVEARAMAVCAEFFKGWKTTDVSTPDRAESKVGFLYPGYDVHVKNRGKELHIEVKGTQADFRPTVHVTANELQTARKDSAARLLVVSDIQLDNDSVASGGIPVLYDWNRDELHRVLGILEKEAANYGLRMSNPDWIIEVSSSPLLAVDLTVKHPTPVSWERQQFVHSRSAPQVGRRHPHQFSPQSGSILFDKPKG